MNFKKIAAIAAASTLAVSAFAVAGSAYDLNLDMGIGWSSNQTIPAEEFAGADENSVFTITYVADKDLADIDGQNYWCIKPHFTDGASWEFANTLIGVTLSEPSQDTYTLDPDGTEFTFSLSAADLARFQTSGMAVMGHGATLGTFSFKEGAPAAAPAAGDVAAATDSSKGSPDTGIADVAVFGGIALVAAAGVAVARKRK